ncbi:Autophagy protein [Mollivirus sibericum]|uniref:Autophagy protein n=1 Tax=Mollivirus sibericum TaxID=1678078 RepID=UPI0006B2EF3B|nr:Autophagy protein [Mollivirus sibericum]ALD62278.1 Autophagy protein [Mollivirus sibericum]
MMKKAEPDPGGILSVAFNETCTRFALGTEHGFQVWDTAPLKPRFKRDFEGGIGLVALLFRTNLLALVGGGKKPQFPTNQVILWDDHRNEALASFWFPSDVKGVRVIRGHIVVALDSDVHVYRMCDIKPLRHVRTVSNPRGLMALCTGDDDQGVLACLNMKPGHVSILRGVEAFASGTCIQAHDDGHVSCLALNRRGTRLATASHDGTVICVWNTEDGSRVVRLRRGKDQALVNHMNFSEDSRWLCVSSSKGTVHVFNLPPDGHDANFAPQQLKAQRSCLGFMAGLGLLPGSVEDYIGGQFSFAQVRVEEPETICTFVGDPEAREGEIAAVMVVSKSGKCYKYAHDPEAGGDSKRLESHIFFNNTPE